MKYSIIPAALLMCSILTGCSASVTEKPAVKTNQVISAEAAEESVTEAAAAGKYDKDEEPEIVAYDDRIKVTYLGKAQEIPVKEKLDDYKVRKWYDYNFDGYTDLYIPHPYEKDYTGEYWLWDNEKGEFVKTDAFSVNGVSHEMKPDISARLLKSVHDRRTVSFRWQGDKVVPVEMIQSFVKDNVVFDTVFGYDEDYNIVMKERRYYSEATQEVYRTEPVSDYLRVTGGALEHMNGSRVVQSIGLDEIYATDKVPEAEECIPGTEDVMYGINYTRLDLDSDGDDDLCITVKSEEGKGAKRYIYYRYDEDSDMFSRWEELTDSGKRITVSPDEPYPYYYEYKSDEEGRAVRYYYRFGDNGPVLFKKEDKKQSTVPYDPELPESVIREDKERKRNDPEEYGMTVYRYDEEGNETVVLK